MNILCLQIKMCEQALLPSPNWFLPTVASCSGNGTLAYGARTGIVLIFSVEKKDGAAPSPNFEILSNAHREKVTTLSFLNRPVPVESGLPPNLLASASEDGAVLIWNVDKKENILQHSEHNVSIPHCYFIMVLCNNLTVFVRLLK
jgi:WD40 repeat protein